MGDAPWEDFQPQPAAESGPWEDFAKKPSKAPAYEYKPSTTDLLSREDQQPYEGSDVALNVAGRGVPILRNYVKPTEEALKFEKESPRTASAVKAAAGVGSTLPVFAAVPGFLGGVGVGAGISGLDSLLHGDSAKDVAINSGIGGAASGLGYWGGKILSKLISPFISTPEHQALVQTLEKEGVDGLTAGQKVGSTPLKYRENVLADEPGSGTTAEELARKPAQQFTEAAMRRTGQGTLATQPEIDAAFKRIGDQFETVGARNYLRVDPKLNSELQAALKEYQTVQPASLQAPIVENAIKDITTKAAQNGGVIPGSDYVTFRSAFSRLSARGSDPVTKSAMSDITRAVDDAMERTIATANPADSGLFTQAREQYRNLLTLAKAASASGENAAHGLISPQSLSTAVKSTEGVRQFARGGGDLSELARAGEGVMKPLPQSGTAPRLNVLSDARLAAILAGAGAGEAGNQYSGGHTGLGAIGGATAGFFGGRALGAAQARMLLSPLIQKYLANQSLTPETAAMLKSFLSSQSVPPAEYIEDKRRATKNEPQR